MKCVLIRHGKTSGNEIGAYVGKKLDESLSEIGIKEIQECRLYDKVIFDEHTALYTSPLERAKQTGKLLFDREGEVIEDFAEIDFGEFEGKSFRQLDGNADYQRWIDSGGSVPFPGGESRETFIQRTMSGFLKVVNAHKTDHDTALVVCHGGTIMAVLSTLTGEDYYDFQVKNLEGYEIEFKTENERIFDLSYNRISFGNPA